MDIERTESQLVEAFAALPPLPECDDFWTAKRADVRARVAEGRIYDFTEWSTTRQTMFVGNAPYTTLELDALRADGWSRWEAALREDDLGMPERLPGTGRWTSGNLVHQAYHLRQWEMKSHRRVDELETIVEIGGGYGALAKVARRAGFTGRYVIFDLPEFSLIQQWYLGTLGIEAEFYTAPQAEACDLLVALWSLSEMDIETQQAYLDVMQAQHYLIAALDANWHGYDTQAVLKTLAFERELRRQDIQHLPGNYYLLG